MRFPPQMMKRLFSLALVYTLTCGAAVAQNWSEKLTTPVQIALANPLQIIPERFDVMGIRINVLYGKNENVSGLDVGLVNYTSARQEGLQAGGFNYAGDELAGVQVGAVNRAIADSFGFQIGGFNSCATNLGGFQGGAVNMVSGDFYGYQSSGVVSVVKGDGAGLQTGVFNFAHGNFDGVQIGVVNSAADLRGVQIGLININSSSRFLSFCPVVNFSF